MKIKELDVVALNRDFRKYRLERGDLGTVVHIYGKNEAYEVEFVETSGYTRALLTLMPDDVRPVKKREILYARELVSA